MLRNVVFGIAVLFPFAPVAFAESFVSTLPPIGTSVSYDYSAKVTELDRERSIAGLMTLKRLPNVSDSKTIALLFQLTQDGKQRNAEFHLTLKDNNGKLELLSATMKLDDGDVEELSPSHVEFRGLKHLFGVDSTEKPIESCWMDNDGLHCTTIKLKEGTPTKFGAPGFETRGIWEVDGKTLTTSHLVVTARQK